MNLIDIVNSIRNKKSFLCIGLDPDLNRLPKYLLDFEDPIFEFNKSIIDVTSDLCIAYKPNLAFYEKLGPAGLVSLQKTLDYISADHFVIADAKRSDIFNSAQMYADTFYDYFNCDAVTLSPYMGFDAIKPFIRKHKWGILLIATSNPSASSIQNIITQSGNPLYLDIVDQSNNWSNEEGIMFVVGATRTLEMSRIRSQAPNHFFLVPGIGAQGGDLGAVCDAAFNPNCGLIINVSRSIIYAGEGKEFKDMVHAACLNIQKDMELILKEKKFSF
tara:strand:- start:5186 stop:6007 length:822 start_codon:yes stop_codon:yes gene_type:complete